MKLIPTEQQKNIVAAAVAGESLKIKAFAGASKTTTLVMVAEALEHNCLYLAYNKKMQLEAANKFPESVEVRTVHSMAYQAFGIRIAHKLERPRGAYRNVLGTASEIARAFKIFDIKLANGRKVLAASIGKAVKDTVAAFENSANDYIGKQHVRLGKIQKYIQAGLVSKADIEKKVLAHAQRLWDMRTDLSDPCLATHETYLKLYQMSKPVLSGYGTIFLDEAQDSNDCVLDIVLSQRGQVIIVGDDFQSIYQWRGSINALEKVGFQQKELTTSFRFGQQLADTANLILNQTVPVDIRGNSALATTVVQDASEVPFPQTKIFRTNAALLLEAVDNIACGKKVYIEVDFKDLLRAFDSAEALFEGRVKDVKHDLFLGCETWEDAKFEAESSGEVARIVKLIENGNYHMIREVLGKYKHPTKPDVIYITAHKAKGLEWDNVIIADDFPSAYKDGEWALTQQERNLAYVAHTRAKKVLCVGGIVHQINDFNEHETSTSSLVDHDYYTMSKSIVDVQKHNPLIKASILRLKQDMREAMEDEVVRIGNRPCDDSVTLADFIR